MLDRKDRAALRQLAIWALLAVLGCVALLIVVGVLGICVHEFRALAGV